MLKVAQGNSARLCPFYPLIDYYSFKKNIFGITPLRGYLPKGLNQKIIN